MHSRFIAAKQTCSVPPLSAVCIAIICIIYFELTHFNLEVNDTSWRMVHVKEVGGRAGRDVGGACSRWQGGG